MVARVETFVVRAWRPAGDARPTVGRDGAVDGGDADGHLRGVVEHVGSGESMPFRDAAELVRFLTGRAIDEEVTASSP
jgi:hypothetical protein